MTYKVLLLSFWKEQDLFYLFLLQLSIKSYEQNEKNDCFFSDAGLVASTGCTTKPVQDASKTPAINLANLDTTVSPGVIFTNMLAEDGSNKTRLNQSMPATVLSTSCGKITKNS